MSNNLNSIDSSFISNISSICKASAAINSKNIKNTLFSQQLENAKKADTYLDAIENCFPKTTVMVKSMNSSDVQKYYKEWKTQPIDYSGFNHSIIVSPKVLEKMDKDPNYAEQMLKKIKKAATPEGFGNATLYEYKVIVRDDGEIETMACADFNNKENQRTDKNDDIKKAEKRKLELSYSHQKIYDQWKPQMLSEEVIKINKFIESQYYIYAGFASKPNQKANLK